MAITTIYTYPLDGTQRDFTVPFEYLARRFVVLTLIGTDRRELILTTDYRFTSKTNVNTNVAWGPADGYERIEIRRNTSATDRLVDFADGSILRASELNTSQVQTMHIAEEARNMVADTIAENEDGNLDARGRRLANLADAVDPGDAVALRRVLEWEASAILQRRFIQPRASHPLVRDDDTPLSLGDRYLNLGDSVEYVYKAGGWAASTLDMAQLQAAGGASEVGTSSGVTVESALQALDDRAGAAESSISALGARVVTLNVVALDDFVGAADQDKFAAAVAYAKSNKVGVVLPARALNLTETIEYNTAGLGYYQGLVLLGAGPKATSIVNKINSSGVGAPAIRLTSGSSTSDQQHGGLIRGVGFRQESAGTGGHGIEYRGTWHQRFEDIGFEGLTGSGFRVVNSLGDADSSAHVDIDGVRAMGCIGPAFDSNGGTGGVSIHSIRHFYATSCGQSDAAVVLDGCVHFKLDMFSITGAPAVANYVSTHKAVHIKSTTMGSRHVEIGMGEMGNWLQKGIVVDSVVGLKLHSFRLVKRSGETTFTTGIEFKDGALGTYNGVDISCIGLQIDHASPAFTYLVVGSGVNERFSAKAPVVVSLAIGNTYVSFTGATAKQRIGYLEDINGRVLFNRGSAVVSTTLAAPGSFTLDQSQGNFHRVIMSATGAYTVVAPDGANGQTLDLMVFNTSGSTISVSFSGFIGVSGYTDPASGTGRSAHFIRDPFSAAWRQIGGWS